MCCHSWFVQMSVLWLTYLMYEESFKIVFNSRPVSDSVTFLFQFIKANVTSYAAPEWLVPRQTDDFLKNLCASSIKS